MRRVAAAAMAASTLPPTAALNPRFLPSHPRRVTVASVRSPHVPSSSSSSSSYSAATGGSCCCSCGNGETREAPGSSLLEIGSGTKRRVLGLGLGLLALPLVTPDDAGARRVEYYATVGERLCDLNFVKSGLGYCDVEVGTGVQPPPGELINIHYTARFEDGTVFDSSYKRARPLTLRIGVGKVEIESEISKHILDLTNMAFNVIPGLDQGILGGGGVPAMLVGGKRKLFIPPALAYGPEPAGCFSGDCNIPANATLLYDILFVGVYK